MPKTFVEDLDAEQLGGGGGAVFVGRGQGDVKGQDLVGIPGEGRLFEALHFRERDLVQLIGRGVDRDGHVTGQSGVDDSGLVGGEVKVLLELGTDIVFLISLDGSSRCGIYLYMTYFGAPPPSAKGGFPLRKHRLR